MDYTYHGEDGEWQLHDKGRIGRRCAEASGRWTTVVLQTIGRRERPTGERIGRAWDVGCDREDQSWWMRDRDGEDVRVLGLDEGKGL